MFRSIPRSHAVDRSPSKPWRLLLLAVFACATTTLGSAAAAVPVDSTDIVDSSASSSELDADSSCMPEAWGEGLCSEMEDLHVSASSPEIPRIDGVSPYKIAKSWVIAASANDAQEYCDGGLCSTGECMGTASNQAIESLTVTEDTVQVDYTFEASCGCA